MFFTFNMKGDWFKMNKKIKRLSIIAMVMIAMIIGINNVNALKVDNTAISQSGKYSATDGGAQVNVTKINSKYTINLLDNFNGDIIAENSDNVIIYLDGHDLSGNVTINSSTATLTIIADNACKVTGGLNNSGTLYLHGGNYLDIASFTPGSVLVQIYEVGTIIPSSMYDYVDDTKFKAVKTNDYYVLAEADAHIQGLLNALNATGSYTGSSASALLAKEGDGTFTNASFANWKVAYLAAQAIVDEYNLSPLPVSEQDRIESAKEAYINAKASLELLADYTNLDDMITKAEKLVARNAKDGIYYTDASLKVLNDAIATALANHDLSDEHQAEVDAMFTAVKKAKKNLVFKADYSQINELEDVIAILKPEDFTPDSWSIVTFIRNSIQRDLAEDFQDTVDSYYIQLKTAVIGLVKLPNSQTNTGTSNPSAPNDDQNEPPITDEITEQNPNDNPNLDLNSDSLPDVNDKTTDLVDNVNTGDNITMYAAMNVISLLAIAGCGIALKKQNKLNN